MPRLSWIIALAASLAACGRVQKPAGDEDPDRPGLAFAKLPASAQVRGRFEVWVRLNDATGQRTDDSTTLVTLAADGGKGRLTGTLMQRARNGVAYFDDLSYDAWESIHLAVSAKSFGSLGTTRAVPIRPSLRFLKMVPAHVPAGEALPAVTLELVDGLGDRVSVDQPVSVEAPGGGLEAPTGAQQILSAGMATWSGLKLTKAGARSLVWKSPGLVDLIAGLTVHDGEQTETLWLPGGRVDRPYVAQLPEGFDDFQLLRGELPKGVALQPRGDLVGVPVAAGVKTADILAIRADGGPAALWKVCIPIYGPAEAPGLDALAGPGAWPVRAIDEVVPVASRKVDVRTRVFFPGGAAPGQTFPLIVFHHGAASFEPQHPAIYDRFDALLQNWTSRGAVVATIDGADLIWADGRLTNSTLANLEAMSENQRAAISHLVATSAQPGHALFGLVDPERVIVAGHSRGGGASILTARVEPSVIGGILIKPLDPMATVGGQNTFASALPPKPFLLITAGNDNNVPYPIADALYERRAAPMIGVTILGSLHAHSCTAFCAPEAGAIAEIEPAQDWAITNAYATAFVDFVARGELGAAALLFGPAGLSTNLSPLGVLVRSDRRAAPLVVDDFQDDKPDRNALDLPNDEPGAMRSVDEPSLLTASRLLPDAYTFYRMLYERDDVLAVSNAHRIVWGEPGAVWSTELGGLDVRGRDAFRFRVRTDGDVVMAGALAVRLIDGEGNVVTIGGAGHTGAAGIGPRFGDFIVPLPEIAAGGVDLGNLVKLELLFAGTGSVLFDDVCFD